MSNDLFLRLKEAVIKQDSREAVELTRALVGNKEDPVRVADVISEALREVGDLFESQELFLPEVMRAANAAKQALNIVIPMIQSAGPSSRTNKATIAIASLGPHDIGKTLVAAMLVSGGFDVLDLGTMVTPQKVLEALGKTQILGLSILLTSDIRKASDIIRKAKGAKPSIKVMVGGAAMNPDKAKEIGADAYGKDAREALRIARQLLGEI